MFLLILEDMMKLIPINYGVLHMRIN